MLRTFLACMFLLGIMLGFSQQPSKNNLNLFQTVRPDLQVVVTKHQTGADMFEVTAFQSNFSPEVLRQSLEKFGKLLGSDPRGLTIFQDNTGAKTTNAGTFLRATFAVSGFWKMDQAILLQPLVKAFTGIPSPNTVNGIDVILSGQKPSNSLIQSYSSNSVEVQGQAIGNPPAVEYRIHLLSQNPEEINIPDSTKNTSNPETIPPSNQSNSTFLYILIGVIAVAVGALVYNLLLGGTKRTPGPKLK